MTTSIQLRALFEREIDRCYARIIECQTAADRTQCPLPV